VPVGAVIRIGVELFHNEVVLGRAVIELEDFLTLNGRRLSSGKHVGAVKVMNLETLVVDEARTSSLN